MFERLITAIIMVVALAIVASGLPLSSISGAGSGALGTGLMLALLVHTHYPGALGLREWIPRIDATCQ